MSLYIDHIDDGAEALMFRFRDAFTGSDGRPASRAYDVTVRREKDGPAMLTVTNLNAGHGTTREVPEGAPPQVQGAPYQGPYDSDPTKAGSRERRVFPDASAPSDLAAMIRRSALDPDELQAAEAGILPGALECLTISELDDVDLKARWAMLKLEIDTLDTYQRWVRQPDGMHEAPTCGAHVLDRIHTEVQARRAKCVFLRIRCEIELGSRRAGLPPYKKAAEVYKPDGRDEGPY